MIPLVILDIDGTLIGSKGHVEDCVWQAVEKGRSAGMKFAVCTGRPCFGVAQKVAERLGPTNPHIFQSGAHIAYPQGEALNVFALKEAVTRPLVKQARELGLVLELYSPNTLFVERRNPLSEAHAKMIGANAIVRDFQDVLENEPIVRAQWVIKTSDIAKVSLGDLDDAQASTATSPALEDTFFISITQKDISKGAATKLLAAAMRLELSDVVGVGDSDGDRPMLDVVGYPVVMDNAPASLKKDYGTHAGSVEACGVVPIIESALAGATTSDT